MTMHVVSPEIDRLKQLYGGGFQNNFLDNALRKVIHHQITRDKADLRRVQDALDGFEALYGLSSADFWERFQIGEMADTADFMEWNAFCKMKPRILGRLRILTER